MLESIRKLRELKKNARHSVKHEYDESGRELLYLQVRDDESFLSPYSNRGEEIIANEVAEYFDNSVKAKNLKKDLHIVVLSNAIDDTEKKPYENGIRNYYRNRALDNDRRIRRNTLAALIMTAMAALIFSLYIILDLLHSGYILLSMIDIAAWVFMWEAVDLYFIERKLLKHEQLRDSVIFNAEITFAPIDDGDAGIQKTEQAITAAAV